MTNIITANIIIIGNEILSGRTIDSNVNYLAKELTKIGIIVTHVRMIADIEQEIIDNIIELKDKCTYLFTTGGIGPTHDDITSESVAKAFGCRLIKNQNAVNLLNEFYGDQINESRLSMADMPEGAKLISIDVRRGLGYYINNLFVLAGIPRICKTMFEDLKPLLSGGDIIYDKIVKIYVGEGVISKLFSDLQDSWKNVSMGSYPFIENNIYGTELVLRSSNIDDLD
ncbi:MAG: competence/damage-inducible protein A, partial [Rickettsiales bacterium]